MKKTLIIATSFLAVFAIFQANAFDFDKEKAEVENRIKEKAQKTGLEMGERFFGLFDSTGKSVNKSFGNVSDKIDDGTIGPDLSKMEREKHYSELSTDDIEISEFDMEKESNMYYFTSYTSNITKNMLKIKKEGNEFIVRVKKGKKYVAEREFRIPRDAVARKRKIEVTEDAITISMPRKARAKKEWKQPYYGNIPRDKYQANMKGNSSDYYYDNDDDDDDF